MDPARGPPAARPGGADTRPGARQRARGRNSLRPYAPLQHPVAHPTASGGLRPGTPSGRLASRGLAGEYARRQAAPPAGRGRVVRGIDDAGIGYRSVSPTMKLVLRWAITAVAIAAAAYLV